MRNIGYREIFDLGELSVKQLNDNLRALWTKVMGDINYRDLAQSARSVIEQKADASDLGQYSTVTQTASAIESAVQDLNLQNYSTVTQTASAIESAIQDLNLQNYSTVTQTASAIESAIQDLNMQNYSTVTQTASAIESAIQDLNLQNYSTVTQTASAIESAVQDLNLQNYSTVTQTASAIDAALSDQSGTTNVSITRAHGLKVLMTQLSSYFQASAEKFGLYHADTDTPIAEAGVEDGEGYFAATRLKNASVSDDFSIDLRSETVTPPSTFVGGGQRAVFGLGLRHGTVLTGGLSTDGVAGNTPSGVRLKAYTGQVAVESPLGADQYSGSAAYLSPIDLYMEARNGAGNDLYLHLNTVHDRIYASRALTVNSDVRLKEDIRDLEDDALIDLLRPRGFRWKSGNGCENYGFVAQEVQAALSQSGMDEAEMVSEDMRGMLSVSYEQIIPLLVLRAKRQSAQIAHLQATVDELAARLEN